MSSLCLSLSRCGRTGLQLAGVKPDQGLDSSGLDSVTGLALHASQGDTGVCWVVRIPSIIVIMIHGWLTT